MLERKLFFSSHFRALTIFSSPQKPGGENTWRESHCCLCQGKQNNCLRKISFHLFWSAVVAPPCPNENCWSCVISPLPFLSLGNDTFFSIGSFPLLLLVSPSPLSPSGAFVGKEEEKCVRSNEFRRLDDAPERNSPKINAKLLCKNIIVMFFLFTPRKIVEKLFNLVNFADFFFRARE